MGIAKFFQSLTNSAVRRELYEFTRGDQKFYYTSGDKPVQDGETIYDAITIKRSSIDSSNDLEKNSLDITFALNSKFAQDCLRSALEENILVKVSKLQFGKISPLWQGRVTSVKPNGVEITLKCETDYTSLGRAGARYKYQRTCCHDLYGKGCKLDKSLWGVQTTIKSVDKLTVELRDLTFENNYFRLGMLRSSTGVNVAIESSSGNKITLIRRLDSLVDQITSDDDLDNPEFFVTVYPGCMKSLNACDRFNNTDNFLGFSYMPVDNPTTTRIV